MRGAGSVLSSEEIGLPMPVDGESSRVQMCWLPPGDGVPTGNGLGVLGLDRTGELPS